MRYINIPIERTGVLIGPDGEVKDRLEQGCSCKVTINSKTGAVSIDDSKDPYMGMKAMDIVQAIARGASANHAFRLLSDNVYFALFDIRDYTGKSQNRVREMRGRIIGTDGRMRANIEKMTDSNIAVRGNTIAIICDIDSFDTAKKAIDMLLSGSEHSAVNKFMERSQPKIAWERIRNIE